MNALRIKVWKIEAVIMAALGISFLLTALFLWRFDGRIFGVTFPRPDLAPVGFVLDGVIYSFSAFSTWRLSGNKKQIVEENDERNQVISALSGSTAFVLQTVLLITILFLLLFMGYLSHAVFFALLAVALISITVFFGCRVYFSKKM